jgi:hypothetical protein
VLCVIYKHIVAKIRNIYIVALKPPSSVVMKILIECSRLESLLLLLLLQRHVATVYTLQSTYTL